MPTASTVAPARPAARSPSSRPRYSARTSQCRVGPTRTGPFGNLLTSSSSRRSGPTRPTITRPLEAPTSTAATRALLRWLTCAPRTARATGSAQEGGGDAGVDRHVQPRGAGQLAAGEGEDRVGDVLGKHLTLQQGALRVELAELVLRHAVDRGPAGAPAAGEDPGPAHHAVRVDAVDLDLLLAELGGQQPHLVRLVGLGGAVGDVVRAGEQAVLAGDVDDVAAHALRAHDPGGLAGDQERAL